MDFYAPSCDFGSEKKMLIMFYSLLSFLFSGLVSITPLRCKSDPIFISLPNSGFLSKLANDMKGSRNRNLERAG